MNIVKAPVHESHTREACYVHGRENRASNMSFFFCFFRSRSEVGNENLDFLTVPSELKPSRTFPPLFWRRGFVYTAIRSSGTHMDLSKWGEAMGWSFAMVDD